MSVVSRLRDVVAIAVAAGAMSMAGCASDAAIVKDALLTPTGDASTATAAVAAPTDAPGDTTAADAPADGAAGGEKGGVPGLGATQTAAFNIALSANEADAMRVVQSAAPDTAKPEPEPGDVTLARRVRLLLGADPAYVDAAVRVDTNDGRVTLVGDVVSAAQARALRRDVALMAGVVGVDATLHVRAD